VPDTGQSAGFCLLCDNNRKPHSTPPHHNTRKRNMVTTELMHGMWAVACPQQARVAPVHAFM